MDLASELLANLVTLATVPLGSLVILLGLAAIALSAFAIHVVHSTVKHRKQR